MVTGITGAGKSSACNFLLGEKVFEVDLGPIAVTSRSHSHTTVLNNKEVEIIDTPGFCEDGMDEEQNIKELGKAVYLARNGVHAIALVVNASHRFTASQVTFLKEIELFGELWPFMFIIFSAAKNYGATEEEQRKRIHDTYDSPKCPENFKKLLDRVDKRFIMFESTEQNQSYRSTKLAEFFKMVDSIYYTNQRVYSNKLFQRAIELYEKEKEKEKNKDQKYQEALNKVETMTIQMNEEIEKVKVEQKNELKLIEEEKKSNKKRYQRQVVKLNAKYDEDMKQVHKDTTEQIRRANDNANRLAREAEQRMRANMEAQLRAEREAREAAERRCKMQTVQTWQSTSSYSRRSSNDDCTLL